MANIYATGSKVTYLGREWSVIGLDESDYNCHKIITDSGRILSVYTDLLEPVVEKELEQGWFNPEEIKKQIRANKFSMNKRSLT